MTCDLARYRKQRGHCFYRSAALPSSVQNEIELNLSFNTCSIELHGICSFPSATVEYEKGSLFSPSVIYELSVRLRFADIESDQKPELFQNIVALYDDRELLRTYSKTSYLKRPDFFAKLLRTIFFPFYYAGLFYDYNTLNVPITQYHSESISHSSTKLLYELQNRFAQVESAILIVDARFGLIRYLLYNWPITSFAVIFLSSFTGNCLLMLSSDFQENLIVINRFLNQNTLKFFVSGAAQEEYVPDNIDEIPCCSDFSSIPVLCPEILHYFHHYVMVFAGDTKYTLMILQSLAGQTVESRVHELCEHLCCGLECLIASIAAVLVFPPRFSFIVWGCARSNIKEWYPEFYNPIINHVKPMRCSYEIVFPLYSFPFIYLIFLLCAVLLFRSILYIFVLKRSKEAKAFYYALISIPKIAIVHAILAGVLYQSFPYIIMFCSLCANAVHLAIEGKVSVKDIAKIVSTSPKHMTMLTVNMMLLAFSLLAISAQKDSSINLFSLLLVPVPPIFYMTTCDWMVYVVIISCLINLVFSSVGDLSSNYRSCTNVCRRTYSCPARFDSCLWCSGHCFRCRYGCMWKSVDQFAEQGELVPQFHGKWPFIAIDFSAFNLVDVIIQAVFGYLPREGLLVYGIS
ncbi:putative adipose-regulatory protein [Dictyocaulus viviparus]|uniref:Putative adipose-regulatory protein n=1 Tax=Dictyocaulus viviparus TaxID=29172 RepID=A0A0D8XMG7_DICVI|nr:putative adipose-regulatory protein [Dictyocaulus viviparus]